MNAQPNAADRRTKLARAIHAAARKRGLDDGTYRALLQRLTGKSSTTDMTMPQLGKVLDNLNGKMAARPSEPGARSAPASPQARKAWALWLSLHQLGAVREPTVAGLSSYAGRVVHKRGIGTNLDWLTPQDLNLVVEGLKSWCARAGFDVPDDVLEAKRLLLEAIWEKLARINATPDAGGADQLNYWFWRRFGAYRIKASGATLDRAAEALGETLRAALKRAATPDVPEEQP